MKPRYSIKRQYLGVRRPTWDVYFGIEFVRNFELKREAISFILEAEKKQ